MVRNCSFILISCLIYCYTAHIEALQSGITCRGRMTFKNVTLTAYYPSNDPRDILVENVDNKGKALATLQVRSFSTSDAIDRYISFCLLDFLDENIDYVTVSMDMDLKIPYGTQICVPELNEHYRRRINLQIRDTASNVKGQGFQRVDICVRSEADSYDQAVNLKEATIVF